MLNPWVLIQRPNGLATEVPWGRHRAWFDLPGGGLLVTGLDAEQVIALRRSYPGFVKEDDAAAGGETLACRARRLPEKPGLAAAELTRDGQYAPRTTLGADGIDLTGANFRALVPVSPACGPGWLGAVEAQDLVQASVIENFLRVFTAHQALRRGGVVLHSAGLVVDGRAFLFAGRSGAGKTTLTRKGHAAGAGVLSDDINLVLPAAGGYQAHAVPFTGEFGRTLAHPGGRAAYPVAGLVLLDRGERLGVAPIGASTAIARLLVACPFVNMEAATSAPLFDALTGLVARLPVIALRCRREDGFATIMTAVTEGFAHA
jgi:hypothetical protein